MGLSVIALTSKAVAEDPGIWRRMDRGIYNIILASPEALLGPRSRFWQNMVRKKTSFNVALIALPLTKRM